MDAKHTQPEREEAPWAAGLRSARANLLPGFVLQVFALSLVLSYYFHGPTREALDGFSAWRAEVGLVVPMVTTAVFGGLIPFFYLRARRATRAGQNARRGVTMTAFWGIRGVEINFLYTGLAVVFGANNEVGTIVVKSLFDQMIYCPIWAIPVSWAFYAWVESGYNTRWLWAEIRRRGWYRRRVVPVLISNVGVWVPAVAIIYSLPTALQLPLQNVVLCFFTLLLAHMTGGDNAAKVAAGAGVELDHPPGSRA